MKKLILGIVMAVMLAFAACAQQQSDPESDFTFEIRDNGRGHCSTKTDKIDKEKKMML
ncbi:MAG: hypothetical protein FWC64_07185 [Treponema sp.]|nr:hypothetical protein [Treponema sp.]